MNMTTTSMAMATATATSEMAMGGSSDCKISMLWNWYTVDACFLSPTWHITSNGMFAGSCIGVIGLVLLLELLRRLQREFDRRLIGPQRQQSSTRTTNDDDDDTTRASSDVDPSKVATDGVDTQRQPPSPLSPLRNRQRLAGTTRHVPTLRQQLVRAALHTVQFAVAYIVMLLAMYYNGYIIVCIFLGVFVGSMVFAWDGPGGVMSF